MARVKSALVLSAGGMFAAYQAGAWKALESHFDPDIVVGASAGALNGWLIASGTAGDKLIQQWLHPSAGEALKFRRGRFDPAPLKAHAERVFSAARPQREFGLVTVEIPRMRTRLTRPPQITASHLHATCAIPFFLPPVKIAGRRHVDGGLLEKLPLQAAIEMGATRIVAVDCMPALDLWWLKAGVRCIRSLRPRRTVPPGVQVTLIEPSEPLGDVRAGVFWQRENAERWIALGERDVRSHLLRNALPQLSEQDS